MCNLFLLILSILTITACNKEEIVDVANTKILYTMPDESEMHEGTWLQWPHQYQYGITYRNSLDATWVAMTKALITSEKVHIIAYDEIEKNRIISLLNSALVSLINIDLKIYQTDDVWIRDNGPIYTRDSTGELVIEDWGFNGWGNKAEFDKCNIIPQKIATDQSRKIVDINNMMINEGGAVEMDGNGTLLATKSSILNKNRNKGMSQSKAESIFKKYLGATNFIWLDGVAGLEITDMHIDGFAKFASGNKLVTMEQGDLLNWDIPQADIDRLYAAKNKNSVAYTIVKIPLTQNNVVTEYGKNLGYKGSYINYYISNTKVLVPNYNDANDVTANNIIQSLYPTRTVVGIDVRNLYENGGMIHCVTQQQPL